ncbi:Uma2 family endonuclease [Aerosakkonemataceae cyanobacterium BLCC-F154]|uniref:Uma2 family endonuclease n=1 Tax=Floridaenema fluviatile BLCC-F154 TaxID=3153640 RepID=A0ABV4YDL6_9CYAN
MTIATPVVKPVSQMELAPGSIATLKEVTWQEFAEILAELGERRNSRIAYSEGKLEIMVPLPEHERTKIVIADLVKAILRSQRRNWEPLGSSTFKREEVAGIEPDECFYIQNQQAVIGKDRIDLNIDPPPDLAIMLRIAGAIESDVTSKTRTQAYLAIKVPEIWIYDSGKLKISLLQGDRYIESETSPTFPNLAIREIIPKAIERAKQIGTSQALLEFEDWLSQQK